MTFTQVGPERTRGRSNTLKRAKGNELSAIIISYRGKHELIYMRKIHYKSYTLKLGYVLTSLIYRFLRNSDKPPQ